MPGLFMKLEPYERFFVNGALIANGDRRSTLNVIENTSVVMRERTLVTPDIVETDLGRLLLLAQNALLGLIDKDHAMRRLQNAQLKPPLNPNDPIAVHLADATLARAQGDLRGTYIALERAFRAEGRSARS